MARDYLSGFEQIVLAAVLQTHGDAYGVTIHRAIKDRTRRDYSFGAIYATLDRLEAKGFVSAAANPSYSRREGPVESTIENDRGGSSMSRTSAHVNRTRLGVVVLALTALLHCSAVIPRASAAVPSPTIEGPITGPGVPFVFGTGFDLSQVGHMAEEFFISGTASAYTNVGPLGTDGKWTVAPGEMTPYKTRILVYRPTSPKKFNGTVVVEWLNVSGGLDTAVDWTTAHTELIRDGFAWMGVSAQRVGVEGGTALVGVVSLPLKAVNPARYGSLNHPGDSFSYDIFSQAGQAIRQPAGPSPLGGLKVKRLIASGDSQSAFRLVDYIDAIHPIAHVYDGYLVHSRGAFGTPLSEAPQPAIPAPGAAAIRSDVDVPVLALETETDLTFLAYFSARQDDSRHFRLWEVAGTAHADTYTLVTGPGDLGNSPGIVDLLITASPIPGLIMCGSPINSGPHHFVVNAAFAALNRWVRTGRPPRSAPRLAVAAGPPVAIMRDSHGNARGGIRTPQVDVPIATFTGEQSGSLFCRLFGTTTPFDATTLASLYPSHRAFVVAYDKAAKRAIRTGFLLRPDVRLMKDWAAASHIGE